MDFDTHLKHLAEHGQALADSAAAAGLDAPVPTCPEWTVRDLVTHQSQVHRWARSYVTTGRTTPPNGDDKPEEPPGADELLDWFRAGHEALVTSLSSAPAGLDCWSFLPAPSPREFWARRQAHETAIHRVDADRAAGRIPVIDRMFAIDGINELLHGFFARPGGSLVADPPRTLTFLADDGLPMDADDSGNAWTITIGPDSRSVISAAMLNADVMVTGDAPEVYLFLWNRGGRDGLAIDGDESLLDLWQEKAQIKWR